MTEPSEGAKTARQSVFSARPWLNIPFYTLGQARKVPTMLGNRERLFYYWLGAHWAQGAGAIVDLGCYAGGSTACLAEGHITAALPGRIHAFDRFTSSEKLKRRLLYPAGVTPFEGEDILPLAQNLLEPWKDRIEIHKGEIGEQSWTGGAIEVLAIDAAKSAAMADHIAASFFPALIADGSVVVQQDYFHFAQPWLAAQMELLADCFTPVAHVPGDSVAFLCTRVPDTKMLEAAEVALLTDAEIFDLLDAARQRLDGFHASARFDRLERALRANPDKRIAWQFSSPADWQPAPGA